MFKKTRRQLTAWYAASLFLVSLAFSLVLYRAATLEMDRFSLNQRLKLERRLRQESMMLPFITPDMLQPFLIDQALIADLKHRLIWLLVLVNAGLLGAAVFLGYLLAGKSLKPIQTMVLAQQRFISDASHELKTPLTALKSGFEVYLRGRGSLKEARNVISDSVADVDRLQTLTENLLQLTAPTTAPTRYFKKIDLSLILKQAAHQLEPAAKLKAQTLTLKVASKLWVRGIPAKLEQLVVILLDNAIKYSPQHSTITVSGVINKRQAKISLTDQGMGINPADLPHIFERFYRSDQARTNQGTGGYGLGLAIAAQIVKQHQGTIQVKSRPHSGSTFTVLIPAAT